MSIDRRTLLAGIFGSQLFRFMKPVLYAFPGPNPPKAAETGDLYLWLHGLVALVITSQNIRILSPKGAQNHIYRLGRLTSTQDPLAEVKTLDKAYALQGIIRTTLPPRDPVNFRTLVIDKVTEVNDRLSAFSLTVPYPDEIIGFRTAKIKVRPKPPQVSAPIPSGIIPLVVVLRYSNVSLQGVSIPNLWTPPAGAHGPIHLHLYVEPNPSESTMHEPQPDLEALMDLFPKKPKFIIDPSTDPCGTTTVRHCHELSPIPKIPGTLTGRNGVVEQMGIWEWINHCGEKQISCMKPLTYENGVCPPIVFIMQGTNWPVPAPSGTHAKKAKVPSAGSAAHPK